MLVNGNAQRNWLRKAQLSADACFQCFSIINGNREFEGFSVQDTGALSSVLLASGTVASVCFELNSIVGEQNRINHFI